VARRRLTIKHLDPWTVLKFGVLANIALTAIMVVVVMVVWFIVDRLGIVDQVCGIAIDIGFTQCGLNTGNLFRALMTIGMLWVVVQTAVMVFMAFLYNLIADLTGGIAVVALDEAAPGPRGGGRAMATAERRAETTVTGASGRSRGRGEAASGTAAMPFVGHEDPRPRSASRPPASTSAMPIDPSGSRPTSQGAAAGSTRRHPVAEGDPRASRPRRPIVDDGEDDLFGSR
jgi:hypothetical protein